MINFPNLLIAGIYLLTIAVRPAVSQQDNSFYKPRIQNHGNPGGEYLSLSKTAPVDRPEQYETTQTEEYRSLIDKIREARKSGNVKLVQDLQKKLNQSHGVVSKQVKPLGYVKKADRQNTGESSLAAPIHIGFDMTSVSTATEQRGSNIGRIWVVASQKVFDAGLNLDYSLIHFYYSDDDGLNWTYYAFIGNPFELAVEDEIDCEIIEDFTGAKYLYVVYGARINANGKYICNLISLRISGNIGGTLSRLEFPGFNEFDTNVSYYKPRITSDNAFWNGAAYIYIAVCQDSANGSVYDFSEKVAMITDPYTEAPVVDYKPGYLWYFSPNSEFRQGHCDIAWFDDPGNGGGSIMLVESGAFYTNTLYLYETTDIGFITASTFEGFLSFIGFTKSSANIASNGLYEDLMIVCASEYSITDHDIQFFSTEDAGGTWNGGYLTSTTDNDMRPDIVGMRNVPGRFHCAFADSLGLFNNVIYSTAIDHVWGPIEYPLNIVSASVSCAPRPGIRFSDSDSCFVVWSEGIFSYNIWGTGGCSGIVSYAPALEIYAFIEGLYDPSGFSVPDSVTVVLREAFAPFNIVTSKKIILDINGHMQVNLEGISNNHDYYIVLKHRNSIETWSSLPINYNGAYRYYYDFVISDANAYGNNVKYLGFDPFQNARYGLFSGDINQDGTIDATDVSTIDNDATNFVSGYVVTDLTGDDFVDGTDFAIADNNAANFVSAITP